MNCLTTICFPVLALPTTITFFCPSLDYLIFVNNAYNSVFLRFGSVVKVHTLLYFYYTLFLAELNCFYETVSILQITTINLAPLFSHYYFILSDKHSCTLRASTVCTIKFAYSHILSYVVMYFLVRWSLSWLKYTDLFYRATSPHSAGTKCSVVALTSAGNWFL